MLSSSLYRSSCVRQLVVLEFSASSCIEHWPSRPMVQHAASQPALLASSEEGKQRRKDFSTPTSWEWFSLSGGKVGKGLSWVEICLCQNHLFHQRQKRSWKWRWQMANIQFFSVLRIGVCCKPLLSFIMCHKKGKGNKLWNFGGGRMAQWLQVPLLQAWDPPTVQSPAPPPRATRAAPAALLFVFSAAIEW